MKSTSPLLWFGLFIITTGAVSVLIFLRTQSAPRTSDPFSSSLQSSTSMNTAPATFQDVQRDLDRGASLIDVRTIEEYSTEHVQGAINIPLSDIQIGAFPTRDTRRTLYLYCRSGSRATQAASLLTTQGYTVVNLGGMNAVFAMGGKSSLDRSEER